MTSQDRRKQDDALIRQVLADTNGTPYDDKINPFEPGLRRDRFERLYKRYRESWLRVDSWWNDLCEVYQTTLTKRKCEKEDSST